MFSLQEIQLWLPVTMIKIYLKSKRQVKDKSDIELCRQEFRKELSDVLAILDIMIDGCQNNLS